MRMTRAVYDAIVIGAGHNGLVCATYLARAGKSVLVLEGRSTPGGCASTREFAPGFSVSDCAQWLYQLHPGVMRDLKLESHGLEWAAQNLDSVSLALDGNHVVRTASGVEGVSAEDARAYAEFDGLMRKYVKLLAKLFEARAPKLVESNLADRMTLARLGLDLKLLGREDMREFMRVIMINMYDLMHETFGNEQLKALLSLDAVLGARMGPRTPGTVFSYLYRGLSSRFGFDGVSIAKGGMGALGQSMASAAKAAGAEVQFGSAVASVEMKADRAVGVRLADGTMIHAAQVISNADPVTTFRELVGYPNIEAGTARRVSEIRHGSGTAKLHLALNGLPKFTGLSEAYLSQRVLIAPDMDYVERAFNAVKYDEYSAAPVLDISVPTLHDTSLAPDGQHVLSAIVQFAPYGPEGGWEQHRQPFIERVLDVLESYAPDIRTHIQAAELLTPQDIEREFGAIGGHWHHGEMSIDQVLMMRPFPGSSQYGTPVQGLYLCGAGAHPGGGVMGLAGRNAAREILKNGGSV
jgi:phytoene dehydrogenase-like protein